MKGMKLSVRALSLADDLRASLAAAQRIGFQGLALEASSGQLDAVSLSGSGQREVRHLLTRHDLALSALRCAVPGASLAGDLDRILWTVQRCVQAAADLQAAALCLDVGALPRPVPHQAPRPSVTPQQAGLILLPGSVDLPMPDESPVSEDELALWPAVQQAIVEIARLADRYGQPVALSSELSSVESLVQAVSHGKSPLLGIELDPVALLRDRWSADKAISEAGQLVLQVRGRDALKGAGARTQPTPLGRGSVDWPQLTAALDQGAFAGWITVDSMELPDEAAQARRAAQYLRDVLRQ